MKSPLNYIRFAVVFAMAVIISAAPAQAQVAEPSMAEYTHYPLFQSSAIAPRIMLVLDNSGSMNFPAYGDGKEDWPYAETIEAPYKGLACQVYSGRINDSTDDGMEEKSTGLIKFCNGSNSLTMSELDLGRDDDTYELNAKEEVWVYNKRKKEWEWQTQWVTTTCSDKPAVITALRFTDVTVPREVDGVPVIVKNAYIEFTALEDNAKKWDQALTLKITAEAADNPTTLTTTPGNISGRPNTTASVTWNVPEGEWFAGDRNNDPGVYASENITTIVQELISRPGWQYGNAMLFKIDAGAEAGGRPFYSFEGNDKWAPRLVIEYEPCEEQTYYGYFDGRKDSTGNPTMYKYDGNKFVRDPSGPWSGNFLNFIAMRRGDVLRKVLVGGLSTSRTGGGNATQIGITDPPSNGDYRKHHVGGGVSPWNDAWYFVHDGYITVRPSSSWSAVALGKFKIEVTKDYDAERDDFGKDGELAGVLQKVGDRAEWGNAWFTKGDVYDGKGVIDSPMGTNMTSLITTIKNNPFDTSTPLAEALYVVTQYFKQEDAEISGYANTAIGPFNNTRDPYYNKDEIELACAQGFCLLLTDGMSTNDQRIPEYLQDYAGDGIDDWPSNGSSFARDVGLYMNTTDLRSKTVGISELEEKQNVILYVVYALGNSELASDLLQETAINGGFRDKNNNNLPDLDIEWDKDGDGIPDNYFEAQDGAKLEDELMNALLAIFEHNGSGTAVSVLATKGEGEGTLVQAIFNPGTVVGEGDVTWTGMLHSLWVDDVGEVREDTVHDYALNPDEDDRILFGVDEETNDTIITRYKGDSETADETNIELEDLRSIWSAGQKLAQREPDKRKVYTYFGDGTEANPDLNRIELNPDTNFMPLWINMNFLGVNDDAEWEYLGLSEIGRTVNLAYWTLGYPDHKSLYYNADLRKRTLADGRLWKLGDIIHSTPTSMAQPLADYDLLYSDQSYYDYYMKNKNRETVVFVGSNSGMLHAFTGWVYDGNTFVNPYDKDGYFTEHEEATSGRVNIGDELWAYIPQCLLPHLKWLADPAYLHVNYLDLRPRVFDAKIFTPSDRNPNGWGSVLVCGTGFAAGMEIPVNPNHIDPAKRLTMYPSYFAFDVTEPRAPVLLWERTFPNLGMAANYPNLIKVEDEWLLAIGSGPTSMDADSVNDASLIIVDLKTGGNTAEGGLKNIFTLPGGDAFANEPVALDKNMNYNVDSVYVAANYNDKTGQVFRLTIPQKDATEFKPWDEDGNSPEYVADPADSSWTLTSLFKSPKPITSSGSVSIDRKDNAWLYFGTGRFLSEDDKTNYDQNYIFGIKDPFFNPDLEDCNYAYPAKECEINTLMTEQNPINDLFNADEYTVYGRSEVEGPEGKTTFDDMVTEARRNVYQGWYRSLWQLWAIPSERVVNKGAVLGGIMLMPTFTPNMDPCGFGGSSRLFAVYYETGTAFFRKIFDQDDGEGPVMDVISLGDGLASSLSIHSGRQTGGKVYIQKSTGEILEIDVNPAFNIKSGPEYWLDDGYY